MSSAVEGQEWNLGPYEGMDGWMVQMGIERWTVGVEHQQW